MRCRLITSWTRRNVQRFDCSSIKVVRELGSKRRETVDFAVLKSSYLLETLSISCYYLYWIIGPYISENTMSADNQQERLSYYISGYVDGEGSFHVAIQKVPHVKFGYQLLPEFHVSQSKDRPQVLKLIKKLWQCGYIKDNFRGKDNNLVYVVRNRDDLLNKVIPFFRKYPMLSEKQKDFKVFATIVEAMQIKKHFDKINFIKLLSLALAMNGKGKYRKLRLTDILKNLESSETIR